MRHPCGFLYVGLSRTACTKGYVAVDGIIKKDRVLTNDSHQPAQIIQLAFLQVNSIYRNLTFRNVMKPRDEISKRRFPRTARSYKSNSLSLLNLKVYAIQYLLLSIAEVNILQLQGMLELLNRLCIRQFFNCVLHT